MSGTHECSSIAIESALFEVGDVVVPQDVRSRAGNQAIRRLQQLAARRLSPIAEMMAL
jgi:DNA-binding protein YbaB